MKKKLIILFSLIIICFGGFSQGYIYVNGHVYNLVNTSVIPHHPVTIKIDTISYNQILYTDINGLYADSIKLDSIFQGILSVETYDCNGNVHDSVKSFSQGITLNIDFHICDSTSTSCKANYTYSVNNYAVQFSDISSGNINSWNWTFGDGASSSIQNPNHVYSQNGTYTVCLYASHDTLGTTLCSDTICKAVTVAYVNKYNLGGQVFAGNLPIKNGYAYLYSVNNSQVTFADSMYFDTLGYYYFPQIIAGTYIVKVVSTSDQYAPAYYGNKLFWNEASAFDIKDSSVFDKDVYLIAATSSSGPGSINGDLKFNGTLKPNFEILLLDLGGNVKSYMYTNAGGNFDFTNIAYGTYILHADEAGMITAPDTITISANNPTATAHLTMSNQPTVVVNYDDVKSAIIIGNIFPNPVQQNLNLEIELAYSSDLIIEVYTLLGQKINERSFSLPDGKHTIVIPVNDLPKGIYFLHISSADYKFSDVRKFIK